MSKELAFQEDARLWEEVAVHQCGRFAWNAELQAYATQRVERRSISSTLQVPEWYVDQLYRAGANTLGHFNKLALYMYEADKVAAEKFNIPAAFRGWMTLEDVRELFPECGVTEDEVESLR